MATYIYIAGMGHSGSTLLDMSLGTLPGVVGLGELNALLEENTRKRHLGSHCSCGKKATDCPVWGNITETLEGCSGDLEKIAAVTALLEKIHSDPVIPVDSSKNSHAYLGSLQQSHALKLIFLTRDVRSWSHSRFLSTGKPILYFILRWVLENWKLRRRIQKMGIEPLWVGYEELSLYPEYILPKIASFCKLEYNLSMLHPDLTNSHIISGNIARTDPEKRSGWKYDARWLLSTRIMLLSPLVAILSGLHKKYVYSHIRMKSMKDFFLFGTDRKESYDRKYN